MQFLGKVQTKRLKVFMMSYNNQIHSYICCCSQMFWGKLQANLQSWKDPLMNLKVKIVNYFVSISHYFYIYLREKMELAQRFWGNNLIQTSEEEIDARIKEFRHVYKIPFLEAVLWELDLAFPLSNLPCIWLFHYHFRFWYWKNQVYKCLKRILLSTTAVYFQQWN